MRSPPLHEVHVEAAVQAQPPPIFALIPGIYPQLAQTRERVAHGLHHQLATFAIINVRRMHNYFEHTPVRVDQEMALAPTHLFIAIHTAQPPFSVVLTD